MERYWVSPDELLELYSVDTSRPGAQHFIELVSLLSLAASFPEYKITQHDVVLWYLKTEKISPLVFWSQMKRDLKMILEADDDTLAALAIPYLEKRTCPALVDAVVHSISECVVNRETEREKFRPYAERMRDILGK